MPPEDPATARSPDAVRSRSPGLVPLTVDGVGA